MPGLTYGTIWAGGDFGLTLIDVINDVVLISWDRGSNTNGPTLSNSIPADIEIYGDVSILLDPTFNQLVGRRF